MAIDFMPKHKGYAALYPKHVSNDSRWKPIYCTLFENYQRKVSKNQCQNSLASPACTQFFFVFLSFQNLQKMTQCENLVWIEWGNESIACHFFTPKLGLSKAQSEWGGEKTKSSRLWTLWIRIDYGPLTMMHWPSGRLAARRTPNTVTTKVQ